LQRAARGKNKSVIVIKGLASFDVDLKAAAKLFAGRFACGSSVTAADEIVVQGDVKDELITMITTKWPHIDSKMIEDLGDQKR
uniref:SUI1 domain-containing protein n=1 Tax=Gongylonema pulchrum TaxID=637853 RepID=A0A183DG25_9BILA